MSHYQKQISEILTKRGEAGQYDPRHIEAYMRLGHSTLDGLTRTQFYQEVGIGVECIKADGIENADAAARSFGL